MPKPAPKKSKRHKKHDDFAARIVAESDKKGKPLTFECKYANMSLKQIMRMRAMTSPSGHRRNRHTRLRDI